MRFVQNKDPQATWNICSYCRACKNQTTSIRLNCRRCKLTMPVQPSSFRRHSCALMQSTLSCMQAQVQQNIAAQQLQSMQEEVQVAQQRLQQVDVDREAVAQQLQQSRLSYERERADWQQQKEQWEMQQRARAEREQADWQQQRAAWQQQKGKNGRRSKGQERSGSKLTGSIRGQRGSSRRRNGRHSRGQKQRGKTSSRATWPPCKNFWQSTRLHCSPAGTQHTAPQLLTKQRLGW